MTTDNRAARRLVHDSCTRVVSVSTERINLSMDKAALAAARSAAEADKVSLSEWLSKAAWERAIWQAARNSAERDRRSPDASSAAWAEDVADRIFGQDAA
jgi:hypothetical protein